MIHLDLFSGIGGFAYAADQVFGDVEHIFCDNDKFCRQVLNKHWPEAKIYDDIKSIATPIKTDLLTGGFPCQPFSAAGLRRGTADERHLWPEMLRVIRLSQPRWVIAENVRGLLNWNGGLVFEQVCADLETAGYYVQPFIIPAIALNAPHRRDRIWFVAQLINPASNGRQGFNNPSQATQGRRPEAKLKPANSNPKDAGGKRGGGRHNGNTPRHNRQIQDARPGNTRTGWQRNWLEVAAELCGVDDGLPARLDGFELTRAKHRQERLKSLGNAIVPQVAMEIMRGMAI